MKPSRRSGVAPFLAMDVMSAANRLEREGRSIVHMEVGEPGAPVPAAVRAAAEAALARGRVGYTEALGLPVLRARIADHYRDRYGVEVAPERIAVTQGSSGAFNLAFLALFDVGDRVGLPTPGYPAYRNIITALGLTVVEIPTTAETRWQVTPALIEAASEDGPLKGLIVASPANPSGTMMTPEGIADLAAACRDRDIALIMDEIYHGLVYAGAETTALQASDDVVVINSFSKYYCMTGWRIGWMVLPPDLVRPVERIAQNLFISPSELSQRAALAAFDATDELETVKAGYAANRALLLKRLPAIGFDDHLPVDGAFYVYASVRRFSNDSVDFARRMLTEAGVAATPGPDFDTDRGHAYIRFSFAGTTDAMAEACDRLERWLR
ncbi:pyridoxal phosphate-dependent aminotransferase [Chthonobacter rhizosphaerae]|uniref:pyridoxal phosphate-dependent aminotransferase n=1 Tax=Chthonobacter rhizosphaerae TaxID=2735553 RepID=UPI0015EFD3BC|nr:aminotransferase class I/II-fold pyridoxal phosphate-dependent enzyme [Chthonobacter rhizosphaerae]